MKIEYGQEIDLAGFESYLSLTSSSIIDTLKIKPNEILIIDDYDSIFNEDVVETYDRDGSLYTHETNLEIANSIWDGQSLMDVSIFEQYDYAKYGMLLLRNLMFKSCCFNTNIQKWFKDNNITSIEQLNGYTRATDVSQIKLITTPNSIKYIKFGTLDQWLDNVYEEYGVVKHDKPTHFFNGNLVQSHYQLLNTLQMSKEEVREFLAESLEFAQTLKQKPEVVRYYVKYPDVENTYTMDSELTNKNDLVYNLLGINDNFANTRYYNEFVTELLTSYYKQLKNGHVYINGNYSVLLGNPIEMLQSSIGMFNGESIIGIGNVCSKRFEHGKRLLGSRSPHVTMGNIALFNNVQNDLVDEYINLSEQIIVINSIGENLLQRLSGADFDSDTMLITDNKYLVASAEKNYDVFKTPTCNVSSTKVKRYYTTEQQCDLDIKTSKNLIGEIVNMSQELNSMYWDKIHGGSTHEDLKDLYWDICELDVLSGIEIDKAKKEFTIDSERELKKIRNKYSKELVYIDEQGNKKKKLPHFFAHVAKQKGYYNPKKKDYSKYHTTMDYVQTIVNGFRTRKRHGQQSYPLSYVLERNSILFRKDKNIYTSAIVQGLINKAVEHRKKVQIIFANNLPNKYDMYRSLEHDFVTYVNSLKLTDSVVYNLLLHLEDKENKGVKHLLMNALLTCKNESFKLAFINSQEPIKQISIYPSKDDFSKITLFGLTYYVKYVSRKMY